MSLILNIDTSTETASVCIARDGIVLASISNPQQKDHAAFLHNAINDIIQKNSLKLNSLSAIAVINGPGSYTGLRVGMASAKGLCYALKMPLITVGSLEVLANAAIATTSWDKTVLYCPLIDARRMEVYTALFDGGMNEISSPKALIINESSFAEMLKTQKMYFFGSGASKFERIVSNRNACFLTLKGSMSSMSKLSFERFQAGNFTDLIDSEPLYIKDFHSSPDFSNKK
jgi:tRNA threonylcarbamoyladenosine biosynthesis protein TsaB